MVLGASPIVNLCIGCCDEIAADVVFGSGEVSALG